MYNGSGKKPKFAIVASMLMAAMLLGTTTISSVTTGNVLAYDRSDISDKRMWKWPNAYQRRLPEYRFSSTR
jgi:hypothetical protein